MLFSMIRAHRGDDKVAKAALPPQAIGGASICHDSNMQKMCRPAPIARHLMMALQRFRRREWPSTINANICLAYIFVETADTIT